MTLATIETVDPVRDPAWRALVEQRSGSLFASPPWIRALSDAYGFTMRANLLLDDAGDATAGFAFSAIDDPLDPRLVSLPFSDFCDPIVDDFASWRDLTADLVGPARRVQLRCLHSEVPLEDERFEVVDQAWWHRVDIDPDTERRWVMIDSSARRAIRKARQRGVTVHVADTEAELRAFFDLHLRVRKGKYGLLAQPYRFFEALWRHFLADGRGFLLLARHDDQVVGGVLFLGWGETLYYKFNASDSDQLGVRPNDLIVWEALAHAHAWGYRYLDFGLSAREQDGLRRFKAKYATDERAIRLLRSRAHIEPSERELEVRRLLQQVTEVLVRDQVPDHVTEAAGDVLYQYFV